MSFNQDHPSTPTRARPADEQQVYDPPAAYYSTLSYERHQASTPTVARPELEQRNYIPPEIAYPPTISPNQNSMSALSRARSAFEQQNYASPAGYAPAISYDQNQASTPTVARAIDEQQNYGSPAAYYSPMSFERYLASTPTRSRPVVEQQNYDPPAAYPSTIPPDQFQASTPAVARPVIEQQNHGTPNRAFEYGRRDRAGFFATVLNPDTNAATPAHENYVWPSEQRTQAQLDAVGQNRAALTSRGQADAALRNPSVVMADSNEAAAISAEHDNRAWSSPLEQRIRAATNATSAMKADRNRAAAKSAERKKAHRAFKAEQRAQAQRDAIERNNNVLAARAQAPNSPWKPPTVTAGANSAVAVSAGRENMDWVSETEQRIRAETDATLAEQNRTARLFAARENMEGITEAEQRVRAQWDAMERDRAALTAREQARAALQEPPLVVANAYNTVAISAGRENMDRVSETKQRVRAETNAEVAEQRRVARLAAARENTERTPEAEQRGQTQWNPINRPASSNPPISGADANRAGTPLAARDDGHDAAQDSLVSSPVITSARAPQSQILDSAADDPTTSTTTSGQRSMINQYRPRAPWSTEELLQMKCTDPRYYQLTVEEKRDRTKAMNRARSLKMRKKAGNAKRSR
jgi:hypothetical protein